jgi:hypothetical protein
MNALIPFDFFYGFLGDRGMLWHTLKLTLIALAAASLMGQGAATAEVIVEENITYGKAGDVELKLDLARPEGDGPFPAIVFIHGGGWTGGNRQIYKTQIQEAAKRGYVAATITYRLMKFDQAISALNRSRMPSSRWRSAMRSRIAAIFCGEVSKYSAVRLNRYSL